jgi:hypothetical protein
MNNLEQTPQSRQADVMRGYFGLPFDFKLTAENGNIFYISNKVADLLTLSKLDLSKFKVQQFTGVIDRNKNKIYFGDTLRFADKVEWYRGEYLSKVALGIISKKQALEEIEAKPYEERLIEENQDFEWLLSSEIQSYWEVVV